MAKLLDVTSVFRLQKLWLPSCSLSISFSLLALSLGETWWHVLSSFMETLIGKELMSLANNQWRPTACEQPSDWFWKWISEAKSEVNELGSRFSLRRVLMHWQPSYERPWVRGTQLSLAHKKCDIIDVCDFMSLRSGVVAWQEITDMYTNKNWFYWWIQSTFNEYYLSYETCFKK